MRVYTITIGDAVETHNVAAKNFGDAVLKAKKIQDRLLRKYKVRRSSQRVTAEMGDLRVHSICELVPLTGA